MRTSTELFNYVLNREPNRGYRVYEFNTLNGDISDEVSGANNRVETNGIDSFTNSLGKNNGINLSKNITRNEYGQVYPFSFLLSSGSDNSLSVKYIDETDEEHSAKISIGDNNVIDIIVRDFDDITIGSNNMIFGDFNTKRTVIGDGNFLYNFDSELPNGTNVICYPKKWSLQIDARVVEYAGEGQKYIEIDNTDKIAFGTEILFGSTASAFVRRIVKSVIGNRVYFDEPLAPRESTFPGAQVMNLYYEPLSEISGKTLYEVSTRTRKVFLDTQGNYHLRKINIGDYVSSVVYFHRDSDGMTFLKDFISVNIPAGTNFYIKEENPYKKWEVSLSRIEGNRYAINGDMNIAHIGRIGTIDGNQFSIVEFSENEIVTDIDIGENPNVVFFEISSNPGGNIFSTSLSEIADINDDFIYVDSTIGIFVGQLIKIEGIENVFKVIEIVDNKLFLNKKIVNDSLSNEVFIGKTQLESKESSRDLIESVGNDCSSYLKG